MVSPPPPPPSGSRPSCPWPFSLLLLPLTASMRRRKDVTIDACISPGKSGKSCPPMFRYSKLDPTKNEDDGSSGENDESGDRIAGSSSSSNEQKLIPDLEACSVAAEKGTLSPMFCATGPGGGGGETSKNKGSSGGNNQFNADFWEKALSAGGKESSGHHLPFIFSARDSLMSSATLKKSNDPFTVVSMRPLSMGSHNTIVDGAGRLVVGIEESSSLVNDKAISKNKKHQERYRREKEKDAAFVEKEEHQQQKKPQPDLRRPKSFNQRRKSSGTSSSASSLSGRFSVAQIAPRWSLDSSAPNDGGITSQSATPASLPPKAKRQSGGSNSKGSMPTPRRTVVKSADMAEDMQQDALACAVRAMDEFDLDTDIAAYIKKEFDKKHGAKWHCVVGKNFGSFVTHETRGFIYLYRGQVAVLLFKAG